MHRWRGEEVATTGGVVEEFEDKCSICTSNLPGMAESDNGEVRATDFQANSTNENFRDAHGYCMVMVSIV